MPRMKSRCTHTLCLALSIGALQGSPAEVQEMSRQWIDLEGRTLVATLVTAGPSRAELRRSDGSIVSVPIDKLNKESRAHIDAWRSRNPASLTDLNTGSWPLQVSAGENGRITALDHMPIQNIYRYRSRHFELVSNIELPQQVAEDIATVFEATLAVLQQAPLGINLKPPASPYRVELYDTKENYEQAGGAKGSGGRYLASRNTMLLALDNLGIKNSGDQLELDHKNNTFILKHEVTHQILSGWTPHMPAWLSEGLAEFIAAAPYHNGTYQFHRMTENILNYVNKWRFNQDPRQIPVVPPSILMRMSYSQWQLAVAGDSPFINYNSAALLTHFFLTRDPAQGSTPIALYLAKLRELRHPDPRVVAMQRLKLQEEFLLQGRTYEQIGADLAAKWRQNQVQLIFK
jgi:hypothetical protein